MAAGREIEYSIHAPSVFIERHWPVLLPDWSVPVLSMLIVMQRSPIPLAQHSSHADRVKQDLRARFIALAKPILDQLHHQGHEAEFFDPRTGLPYHATQPGITLNDVAVVHTALNYALKPCGPCHCVIHPIWGSGVYPSIMMSSAAPCVFAPIVAWALEPFATQPGWGRSADATSFEQQAEIESNIR